jgi:UDP-2-acetamido-3-amino-2,3-dideoxy-glucuronate N-acetyltransferase
MDPEVFVHPSAIVDDGATIGPGTRIWHWVHVSAGARIGANCSLGQNVFVSGGAVLGNNVRVQNNVSIYDEVVLDDDVFCGPSMVFTNVVNPRSHVPRKNEYRPTRVGRGATLGANSTIVCGHDIGAYAFIGAGAVVTSAVPPYALMVGVPARRAGWMCSCGLKLDTSQRAEAICSCGRRYRLSADRCLPLE